MCALAVAVPATACSSEPVRTTASFCELLRTEQARLAGPVAQGSDVDDMVQMYRRLESAAPLSVEAEWQQLATLVELAATTDLDDPDAVRRLEEQAYATERAARDAASWARTNCGIELPTVGTAGR
jgi:hypothetical protein